MAANRILIAEVIPACEKLKREMQGNLERQKLTIIAENRIGERKYYFFGPRKVRTDDEAWSIATAFDGFIPPIGYFDRARWECTVKFCDKILGLCRVVSETSQVKYEVWLDSSDLLILKPYLIK